MFSMRRINRALGVSVGVVGLVASAYVNVSATKAEAVSSQPVVSAELNEDSVRLPATAPCTRMTDFLELSLSVDLLRLHPRERCRYPGEHVVGTEQGVDVGR